MAQPSNVSFSKRRQIVRALRRAQRRRRVIAEGIRLVFGGFLSAGILMAAVVVGTALWFSQRMASNQHLNYRIRHRINAITGETPMSLI